MGMGYSLPGHHSQGYTHQPMHQYPAVQGQGTMYPMPMAPYGHNPGGMYGMPYPVYPPYAIPQYPGPQHGTHYQPHGTQMQTMQNMQNIQNFSPGQISPYGYYPHSPYGVPYGVTPTGQIPQAASPVRTNTSSPPKPGPLHKEDKRVDLEYDVSKTIVDGSNPMKLAQPKPQPLLSGELSFLFFLFPFPFKPLSLWNRY
jgi:hypothetical protein